MKVKSLREKAKDNSRVTRGTSKEQETLKEGIPNDHTRKHITDTPMVGVSVGSTLNMDNYESLRVDVWLSDIVKEDETVETAYKRVIETVSSTLEEVIKIYR
jgi:hypothetical protein